MGTLIDKSYVSMEMKAFLNLLKNILYMVIYLHLIACYTFYFFQINAPEMFTRQYDGSYLSEDMELYKDPTITDYLRVNQDDHVYDALFGEAKTFKDQSWIR